MPFGPLYTALPLAAATATRPATRYVDENAWNTLIGNFSLWQDNVNANAKNLSNAGVITMASGAGYLSGNVGIGTPAPEGQLDVSSGTLHGIINSRSAVAQQGLQVGTDVASWQHVLNLSGGLVDGNTGGGVNIAFYAGGWMRALQIRNAATIPAARLLLMADGGAIVHVSPGPYASNALAVAAGYTTGTLFHDAAGFVRQVL